MWGLPQGVYVDKCPVVDLLDEVVLEVELLEGVEVDEGAVLHDLDEVVVEADHLETGHVAEGVARHGGDPVLVQRHALKVAHLAESTGMEGCMRLADSVHNLVDFVTAKVVDIGDFLFFLTSLFTFRFLESTLELEPFKVAT